MLKLKPNNKQNTDDIKQLASCVSHWEYNWHTDFQSQFNMICYYRPGMCAQKFICKNLTTNVMILVGEAFEMSLGHEAEPKCIGLVLI